MGGMMDVSQGGVSSAVLVALCTCHSPTAPGEVAVLPEVVMVWALGLQRPLC